MKSPWLQWLMLDQLLTDSSCGDLFAFPSLHCQVKFTYLCVCIHIFTALHQAHVQYIVLIDCYSASSAAKRLNTQGEFYMEFRRNFWKHPFPDIDEGEIRSARGDKHLQKRKNAHRCTVTVICTYMYVWISPFISFVCCEAHKYRKVLSQAVFFPFSLLLYRDNE